MIYFTVGPSQIHPHITAFLSDAAASDIMSLHHRSPEFQELYKQTSEELKKLFEIPSNFHIFFTASSLENMERVIQNTVEKKSLHIITGAFGKKFFEIAKELGKSPEKIEFPVGEKVSFASLPPLTGIEVIALTQNETSTGVVVSMDDISEIKKQYPSSLIALDIVSSAPYAPVDYSLVDIAFLSSQKLLGLPAGVGILIVSEKAIKKARSLQEKGVSIGSFHNFVALEEAEKKFLTVETPNVLGVYLLWRVLKDMNKKTIQSIRKEIKDKSDKLYAYFSSHSEFSPAVKDIEARSDTTIVIDVKGKSEDLRSFAMKKGFAIGEGYGALSKEQIRIANFPSHTIKQVEELLTVISEYKTN